MNTLEASFRIVTPMFIGGADQTPDDGIRPPSVKGALRFWWRALNWGRFFTNHSMNEAEAMKALHKREAELFGLAAKTENSQQIGGQGVFLLSVVKQPNLSQFVTDWPKAHTAPRVTSKSGYPGLGLFEMKNHLQRHAINESNEFTLKLLFRPDTSANDINEIRLALTALGLFGGLGSRSRRGFGSVALTKLNGINTTQSLDEYTKAIGDVLNQINRPTSLPLFTAFSGHAKVAHGIVGAHARQVHSEAGDKYLNHRKQPSLRGINKRWFGYPLEGVSDPQKRRSSPLFFHIHPVGNQFVCLNIFLPSKFLPDENTAATDFTNVASFLATLTVLP